MKAEFRVLRDRHRISVALTRDSVAAGDDADAPHQRTVETYSFLDPAILAQQLASGYLPSVTGSNHSWTCVLNEVAIAEVGASGAEALVMESPFGDENHAHFVYHYSRS